MGKHVIVVIGPAGSGKSTLCKVLQEHYMVLGRTAHLCNLDPAADELLYDARVDIRELIDVDDAMRDKKLGPNGGLVFCMEYLMEHGASWLYDQLGDFMDDFLIVDMPGQIELTSHIPVVPTLVGMLQQLGYFVVVCFLLDALAATADAAKFVSGCLMSVSSMVCLECPFVNVMTKCDLLPVDFREKELEHYCCSDFDFLNMRHLPSKWKGLTRAISTVVADFNIVSYQPMDITDCDFVANFANMLDEMLQYTDEAEVRDRDIPLMDEIVGNGSETQGAPMT